MFGRRHRRLQDEGRRRRGSPGSCRLWGARGAPRASELGSAQGQPAPVLSCASAFGMLVQNPVVAVIRVFDEFLTEVISA